MIQQNELRKGNYINDGIGFLCSVIEYKEDSITVHYKKSNITSKTYYNIAAPIKLTDEIIEYLGFEKVFRTYTLKLSNCILYFKKGYIYIGLCNTGITDLHDLQNLYFVLEKKELLLSNEEKIYLPALPNQRTMDDYFKNLETLVDKMTE